jgi:hypothetical protein
VFDFVDADGLKIEMFAEAIIERFVLWSDKGVLARAVKANKLVFNLFLEFLKYRGCFI